MSIEKIKFLLDSNNFDFHYLDKVDSTMSEIKKYNFKRNICLIANEQTKGIGRRGATWESPKGNIYISILYKNIIDIQSHFINNAYTTNIICDVIEKICNVKTEIKWPNDILVNNKKISGLISEVNNSNNNTFINTGIGINLISSPQVEDYLTTNINEYKKDINNFDFIFKLLDKYFKNLELLYSLSNSIMDKYKSRLKFLGSKINLKINDGTLKEGFFYGINSDGSIILKSNSVLENIYNARIVK